MKKLLPGKTLAKEFLKPRGLTPEQVAKDISVPARDMNEIVQGKRAITFEMLFDLGRRYFGSSVLEWWSTLRVLYDMERFEALHKWLSAEVKQSAVRDKLLLPGLKRSAVGDKSFSAELKRSAALYKSLLPEVKECAARDKLLSAELKKFYALAKMRLLVLLRSSR